MATDISATGLGWQRYPLTSAHADARRWIQSCAMLGLARNTIAAYSRAMEIFLGFCEKHSIQARYATRQFIAQYVHYLRTRPRQGQSNIVRIDSQAAFANAHLAATTNRRAIVL